MPRFKVRYDKITTSEVEVIAEDLDEAEILWSDQADCYHYDAFELYTDYHLSDIEPLDSEDDC